MLQNMFPVSFDELQKILDLHIMNYSTKQPTPAINIKCLHIIIEDWFDVLHETMFLFLVRNYLENVLNVCVLREKHHRERHSLRCSIIVYMLSIVLLFFFIIANYRLCRAGNSFNHLIGSFRLDL